MAGKRERKALPLAAASDWSATQGHILTGDGKMSACYVAGRDYSPEDLPHYHMLRGTSQGAFRTWIAQNRRSQLVVGAWCRPLFCGGWREDTSTLTRVFNLQTPSIFIDFRVPYSRPDFIAARSLQDLSRAELRLLARQHCFAGYSLVDGTPPVCTRHHAIDWNAAPRRLPNKWRIELKDDGSSFKEFCYANDEFGQAVYMERWDRLPGGEGNHYLALRAGGSNGAPDQFLVIVGVYFTYIRDRPVPLPTFEHEAQTPSLTNLVDDPDTPEEDLMRYLDLECSNGRVSDEAGDFSWIIGLSTFPWRQGEQLLRRGDASLIVRDGKLVKVVWRSLSWEVLECSGDVAHFSKVFGTRPKAAARL
eukprot:m.52460 g.52460  ORF g.52460 m.52460 type:complete len:362 (+) comp6697_c0_seq1:57-1142(+)